MEINLVGNSWLLYKYNRGKFSSAKPNVEGIKSVCTTEAAILNVEGVGFPLKTGWSS